MVRVMRGPTFDANCDCPRGPSSHQHAVHATNCASRRSPIPSDLDRWREVLDPDGQRTIQIVDHAYRDTSGKEKCDVCSFTAWLHKDHECAG